MRMQGSYDFSNNRIANLALLLTVAVILGYVESVIPLSAGVPGIKLGLANCAILFVLYRYGAGEAVLVSLLRTAIIALLFTNLSMLLYSLAGAICSILVMSILKQRKLFSIYGTSMAGGVVHNMAQMLVALLLLRAPGGYEWWFTSYLPLLMICGLPAGMINAFFAGAILQRMKRQKWD